MNIHVCTHLKFGWNQKKSEKGLEQTSPILFFKIGFTNPVYIKRALLRNLPTEVPPPSGQLVPTLGYKWWAPVKLTADQLTGSLNASASYFLLNSGYTGIVKLIVAVCQDDTILVCLPKKAVPSNKDVPKWRRNRQVQL